MSHNSDKLGCSGTLQQKSDEELHVLLERQQVLLKNRAVIQRLPDKGEKIKDLSQKIIGELELRKNRVDDAVLGMSGLRIDRNDDELSRTLGEIINTGQREKVYINAYDRVMYRHEQDPTGSMKPTTKFHPNSTTKGSRGGDCTNSANRSPLQKNLSASGGSVSLLPLCSSVDKSQSAVRTNVLPDCSNLDPSKEIYSGSNNASENLMEMPAQATMPILSNEHSLLALSIDKNDDGSDKLTESVNELGENFKQAAARSNTTVKSSVPVNMAAPSSTAERYRCFTQPKHGYDECLLDLHTPRHQIKLVDFEETYSVLRRQFALSHTLPASTISHDSVAQKVTKPVTNLAKERSLSTNAQQNLHRYREAVEVLEEAFDSDDSMENEDEQ